MTIALAPASIPAPARKYTVEEYLAMPDGDRYEFIDGELREDSMGMKAATTTIRAGRRLDEYAERSGAGVVCSESLLYRIFANDQVVRRADVSFFRAGRAPSPELNVITTAPDLVVEVVSPSNETIDDRLKVEAWLNAGVGMVWVLLPDTREVTIYRRGHRPRILTAEDTIEGDDLLPGFSAVVANLFPPPELAPPVEAEA